MHEARICGGSQGWGLCVASQRGSDALTGRLPGVGLVAAVCLFTVCLFTGMLTSLDAAEPELPPLPTPISGSLVICGGGAVPQDIREKFMELAGGSQSHLVLITTASIYADTPGFAERVSYWSEFGPASLTILHTRSREVADEPEFSACLEQATGVWFGGGDQNFLADTYLGTLTESRLRGVLNRGGVLGGTSAGAAIMSRVMICEGKRDPVIGRGFGFLPNTIVDQHFNHRDRMTRLTKAVNSHPGNVGIGIDECTALVVTGRKLQVVGDDKVTVIFSAGAGKPERVLKLAAGDKGDLVGYARVALNRAGKRSTTPAGETVSKGTLVIAGSGPTPPVAVEQFLKAAGGEAASLVVLADQKSGSQVGKEALERLKAAGATNVLEINGLPETAAELTEFDTILNKAQGVWFAGDSSQQLVHVYVGRRLATLLQGVLERGGVVGGAAAGGSIQGEYVVTGAGSDNSPGGAAMSTGFGFLKDVAIASSMADEAVAKDLRQLRASHPDTLGVAIDPAGAMVVRGSTAEVVGDKGITVVGDAVDGVTSGPESILLLPGERFDFLQQSRMAPVSAAVVSEKGTARSATRTME